MFILHFTEHHSQWPSLKYTECFDTENEALNYARHYNYKMMEISIEDFSTHKVTVIKEKGVYNEDW